MEVAKAARLAAQKLATATLQEKNQALAAFKKELVDRKDQILAANREDMQNAKVMVEQGKLSSSLFARLDLSGAKYESLLKGLDDIIAMPDPIGKVSLSTELSEGLQLHRVSCPIGVLCIIFEARPEAAVQIAALALKSGNALLLKGGKEATKSNTALGDAMRAALKSMSDKGIKSMNENAIQNVVARDEISALLKLDKYIDLVIPRGSNDLVKYIKQNTMIPVLGHADGICAVYVDKSVDAAKGVKVVVDSKTNYPAACNALETLLVHKDVVSTFLPAMAAAMPNEVVYKADASCLRHLPADKASPAEEEDFNTEFLGLKMAVRVVSDVEGAIEHINSHGSGHTDCVLAQNRDVAERFMDAVDSADVFHNCSTRFADGFRFGFGAEVGISTNRIHARGPVGLEGLVIYKYRLYGDGHTAGDFAKGVRKFSHINVPDITRVESVKRRRVCTDAREVWPL